MKTLIEKDSHRIPMFVLTGGGRKAITSTPIDPSSQDRALGGSHLCCHHHRFGVLHLRRNSRVKARGRPGVFTP